VLIIILSFDRYLLNRNQTIRFFIMKLSTNPTLLSTDGQPEAIIELETMDDYKVKNQSNSSVLQKRSHRLISASQKQGRQMIVNRINKVSTIVKPNMNGKVTELTTHCSSKSRKYNVRNSRLRSKDMSGNSTDLKV